MVGAAVALLGGLACSDSTAPGPGPGPGDPGDVALEVLASGLSSPVFVTDAPGDPSRLFIVEKPGRIRVLRDATLLATPFLDLSSITSDGGERGLLGLAFHPRYATNGHFFVNHTDNAGNTRILRFSGSGDLADAASLEIVLEISQPYGNHNGGHLAFGPDGLLYIGMGDGGSAGDPDGNGQDLATLLGSMLRIDVDALPYSVPSDNPFVGDAGAAPEAWAYGLRNPWRFSFDRVTGDLWIGDVGQNAVEEVSFQSASSGGGENYGWNRLEGSRCYAPAACDPSGTVLPVHEYEHGVGCSVTGGYVYRGSALPALTGRYLFADYCQGWVRSFAFDGSAVTDVLDHSDALGPLESIVSFGEDAAGELYIVSMAGTVYRLVPSA
jgi:glucose/arabinose dehydrogenase